MSARDLNPEAFSAALTRREAAPDGASAPTVLDAAAPAVSSAPTRLDPQAAAMSSPTVLDRSNLQRGPGLVQLPSALRARYGIVHRLPTAGAEADLFVVETVDEPRAVHRVVKLYRFGIAPKADVLARIRDADPQHLVRIFEFGESDGHWYEVMEYMAHGSLRQFMRGQPLPSTNLVDLVRELSIGLAHLHQFGLIHRDLKPENVLVREPMPLDLVITDFGISSLSELSHRYTSANRTVRYSAPEALSGLIGKAVDYWSLGMMVAEAAMGRHPLADLTDERAVTQWLTTRPIDLSGIADPRVQTLCRGLLLRDPVQRWGDEQITRWLAGDATLGAPREESPTAAVPAASGERRAATPYLIGGQECWTAAQLGVALARHWDVALRDMGRGLLRRWCEKELPSVAIERLFMDLEESSADPNDKLLDLILHLCPDVPPTYRGENLSSRAALAALVARAGSTSESARDDLARTVVRQIRAGLLSRFRLAAHPEPLDVQRRLNELGQSDAVSFQFDTTQGAVEYPEDIGGISEDALPILEVGLAVDPDQGDRIRADAREFADGTSFRFWFHDCVERGMHQSSPISDAILMKGRLAAARHWYSVMSPRLWRRRLAVEELAPHWRALIDERFDLALSVVDNLDLCVAACIGGADARAAAAGALGLVDEDTDLSPECRRDLVAALAAARGGDRQPLYEWMDAAWRLADDDVVAGIAWLAEPALDPQLRELVRNCGIETRSFAAPARWSLIGALASALRSLEANSRSIAALQSAMGTRTQPATWLLSAGRGLCRLVTSAEDAAQAFVSLKDILARAAPPFGDHVARLAAQAQRCPVAASSLLREAADALQGGGGEDHRARELDDVALLTAAVGRPPAMLSRGVVGGGPVFAVAISPSGRVVATGGSGIHLWDSATGVLLRTLDGQDDVYSISFGMDGRVIASGGEDAKVRMWDVRTGALLHTLEGHGESIVSVAFRPDGRVVASGARDRTIRLWGADTGVLLRTLEGHGGSILSLAFSPDGRLLASSGDDDKSIRLWDVASGSVLRTLNNKDDEAPSVAFSPDGRILASGGHRVVRLWDTDTGALLRTLKGHGGWIHSVAFSRDGRVLASAGDDKTVRLWDTGNDALLNTLEGHGGNVWSVALSPDGRVLASGSADKTFRLWEAGTDTSAPTPMGHGSGVWFVTFSPDGRVLASGSGDASIRLWDTGTGASVSTLTGQGTSCVSAAFSPGGRLLAAAGFRSISVWNTSTGAVLRTLEGHSSYVQSVAFSPDGRLLASGSDDKTIRLWDANGGALLRTLEGHSWPVQSVAFSPDGRLLASGSNDKTIRLWDASSGALLRTLKGHGLSVQSVAFSPDGRLLASGSDDNTIRLWDASSGALLRTLEGHGDCVQSVAFSPDGRLLASGSDDKTIRLWDAGNGALLRTLEGHSSSVQSVAFSPDGRLLASGGGDGALRFHLLGPSISTPGWLFLGHGSDPAVQAVSSTPAQDWVERAERVRSRLLTLMWLNHDWMELPVPEPRSQGQPAADLSSQRSPVEHAAPDERAETLEEFGNALALVARTWNWRSIVRRVAFTLVVVAALVIAAGFVLVLILKQDAPNRTADSTINAVPASNDNVSQTPADSMEGVAGSMAVTRDEHRAEPVSPAPMQESTAAVGREALSETSSSLRPDLTLAGQPLAASVGAQLDSLGPPLQRLRAVFDVDNVKPAIIAMLTASAQQDVIGLVAAAARIKELPKPERGDRQLARALNAQGLAAMERDPAAAAVRFIEAAEHDPLDAEVLGNLAYAIFKAGDPHLAAFAAVVSLALTPERASTWGTLALALVAMDTPEAVARAAWHNAYRYAGNPEKSVEYLTRLASENPDPRVRAFAERTLPTLSGVVRIDSVNHAR